VTDEWQVVEGRGWIGIPGFGRIDPRRDNVDGGRQYFSATTESDEILRVIGEDITGGPDTWYFEYDQPFWLTDRNDRSLEVMISLLEGGQFAVKYREGEPPDRSGGGW